MPGLLFLACRGVGPDNPENRASQQRDRPMHILCPHCHNPIELVRLSPREEIACPSCGSSFCLDTGSTSAGTLNFGQLLGRFTLLDTVGQGAFGTVYLARDPELDRTVAL